MRLHRIGSRPAKGPFGSFWVHPKGTRTRSGRKPCTCLGLFARRFATLIFWTKQWIKRGSEDQRQGFRAVARLTFVLAKVSKTTVIRKTHRMKVRIDYIAETLMCKCLLTRTVANDTYVYQMLS